MAGQPWFKFYPSDWRSDPLLRACSAASRGVLIELICLMQQAEPYGHLLINGRAPAVPELAAICSLDVRTIARCCKELTDKGVLSVDAAGVLYSRRMVRKEQQAAENRDNGRKGGNPALLGPRVAEPVKSAAPETPPRLAFKGKRFQVWKWQHDEFVRSLGSSTFDLLGWYPKLDAEMVASGAPIVDEFKWLKERLHAAAGIERPRVNLFGPKQAPAGTEPCIGKHNPPCATPRACYEKTRARVTVQ